MTSRLSPGELTARQLPVTPDERRLPECKACGSSLIRVGMGLACERCGEPDGAAA